jgi:hypothetical protein
LFRKICELNKKTVIKVKDVGMSSSQEIGENITQGSIGGALIRNANLDFTVNSHFEKVPMK